MTLQLRPKNQKIPTIGAGKKLRKNGEKDKRTNGRRVVHRTLTSWVRKKKQTNKYKQNKNKQI